MFVITVIVSKTGVLSGRQLRCLFPKRESLKPSIVKTLEDTSLRHGSSSRSGRSPNHQLERRLGWVHRHLKYEGRFDYLLSSSCVVDGDLILGSLQPKFGSSRQLIDTPELVQ